MWTSCAFVISHAQALYLLLMVGFRARGYSQLTRLRVTNSAYSLSSTLPALLYYDWTAILSRLDYWQS
eukprot:4702491-Amphidinium_carterae.3